MTNTLASLMTPLKEKIVAFLKSNPPVAHRRTPPNIAWHVGGADAETRVALDELVRDGVIRHRLAKNMQYWMERPSVAV